MIAAHNINPYTHYAVYYKLEHISSAVWYVSIEGHYISLWQYQSEAGVPILRAKIQSKIVA